MEDKSKFIIMALIGILVISLLFNLQIYTSKQAIMLEKEALQKDKLSLAKRIEDVLKDSKSLEDRVNSLNADLNKISKEKGEVQSKLQLAVKEKQDLENKLRLQPKQITAAPAETTPAKQPLPSTSTEAYWAGVLKEKITLEAQLEGLRGQLKALQINNEQLLRDKNSLDMNAKNLAREKQDLERQYDYNQKRSQEIVDKLARELVIEKNDKFQIEETLKSVKSENEILKRQFKTQGVRKGNLEVQLVELQKEKTEFENKLGVMDTVLKDNITQLDNFKRQLQATQQSKIEAEAKKESVELAPIIVRPKSETQSPSASALAPKGKILKVNAEDNFVIIDLGEDSGLRLGDALQVYRQDKTIATIEIIQLQSDIAACDIKKQTSSIMTGDSIR